MSRHSANFLCNKIRLRVRVVHAVDHGVFKRDATPCFFEIPVTGGKKRVHIVGAVDRHDARARFTVGRMERDREGELQITLGQRVDHRHDAAGGK